MTQTSRLGGSSLPPSTTTAIASATASVSAVVASSVSTSNLLALQELGGSLEALHRSPTAVVSMLVYDTSKDSDGGAWVDRCSDTSWFNEALNGTWLPGGFASEMDARDYLASKDASSIVSGNDSTFNESIGAWVATNSNVTLSSVAGRLRLTLAGVLGTTGGATLRVTTIVGQRYQVAVNYVTAQITAQNAFISVGTSPGSNNIAQLTMGATPLGMRYISFLATSTVTYLTFGSSSTWSTGHFAEIDSLTLKPVSFTVNPSGAYYQLTTDGKFYRLYKNVALNSGFSGGVSGVPGSSAVAPTGWSFPSPTGSVVFSASSRYPGEQQLQSTGTAERPYLQQTPTLPAGIVFVASLYVEAVTSGTPTFDNVLAWSGGIAGVSVTYRRNGVSVANNVTVNAGDLLELSIATTTTGGATSIRVGLGAGSTATGNVTISPVQFEYLSPSSSATGYESKAVGVGSQVETFRGNKAKFPRLSALVADSASITIYDLTEAGRPMWMRFVAGYFASAPIGPIGITAAELVVGHPTTFGSLRRMNFISERCTSQRAIASANSSEGYFNGSIAQRNTVNSFSNKTGGNQLPLIANENISAISMRVMPNAPVDPATGLQVPTIACATSGGVSILQHDGAVRNSSSTSSFGYVSISKDLLIGGSSSSSTIQYVLKPGSLGASFGTTSVTGSVAPGFNDAAAIPQAIAFGRNMIADRVGARLGLMRLNETTFAQSLAAWIGATYNTGWWCGDVRRVWCADVSASSISNTELVTNGTFNADVTGWLANGTASVSWDSGSGGRMLITRGATTSGAYQVINTVPGRSYSLSITITSSPYPCNILIGTGLNGDILTSNSQTGLQIRQFVATTATTTLYFPVADSNAGATTYIDSVSVVECVADRCYKGKPTTVYGTLTRTAVATSAQLVAYSGFSAANYLQEPYSADLDFGTAGWTVSAWVSLPSTGGEAQAASMVAEPGTTNLATNGDFSGGLGTEWAAHASFPAQTFEVVGGRLHVISSGATRTLTGRANGALLATKIGKMYRVTLDYEWVSGVIPSFIANSAYFSASLGNASGKLSPGGANIVAAPGVQSITYYFIALASTSGVNTETQIGQAAEFYIDNVVVTELQPLCIIERRAAAGAFIRVGYVPGWSPGGLNVPGGTLYTDVFDGTTLRAVTSPASYNTGTFVKCRATYDGAGKLSLSVNGREVASTSGSALLTLNNASAVTTLGNSRTLDAPFPGSITLVKASATVPTTEAVTFMYEQEKAMFNAGAQITLPSANSLLDIAYDSTSNLLQTIDTANEATFSGLVRTSTSASTVLSKTARGANVKLLARTSTGVDAVLPALSLREENSNRARTNSNRLKPNQVFDFDAVTSQVDFTLPAGWQAIEVTSAGSIKREVAGASGWTRVFDGFRETVRFGTAPGNAVWVQITATPTDY